MCKLQTLMVGDFSAVFLERYLAYNAVDCENGSPGRIVFSNFTDHIVNSYPRKPFKFSKIIDHSAHKAEYWHIPIAAK